MGMFDIENNVVEIPIKYFMKKLPQYTHSLIYEHGEWFRSSSDTSPLMFRTIKEEFGDDFIDSIQNFIDEFENIQIKPINDVSDLLTQIENELKQRIRNIEVSTTKLFLSFQHPDNIFLKRIYESYLIRYKLQQFGYETDPFYVGYIKTQFKSENRCITWYFPIVAIQK